MPGRISAAMERALLHVASSRSTTKSALECGVDPSALRRAMKREGQPIPPRQYFPPPELTAAVAEALKTGKTRAAAMAHGVRVMTLRSALRKARQAT